MLLSEIFDKDAGTMTTIRLKDLVRKNFTAGDTEFTVTAQPSPENEDLWFVEVAPRMSDKTDTTKPRAPSDVFKIFAGVQQSIDSIVHDYNQIKTIVFRAKDTALSNAIFKAFQRKPIPGWKLTGQSNGWLRLSRE